MPVDEHPPPSKHKCRIVLICHWQYVPAFYFILKGLVINYRGGGWLKEEVHLFWCRKREEGIKCFYARIKATFSLRYQ